MGSDDILDQPDGMSGKILQEHTPEHQPVNGWNGYGNLPFILIPDAIAHAWTVTFTAAGIFTCVDDLFDCERRSYPQRFSVTGLAGKRDALPIHDSDLG